LDATDKVFIFPVSFSFAATPDGAYHGFRDIDDKAPEAPFFFLCAVRASPPLPVACAIALPQVLMTLGH